MAVERLLTNQATATDPADIGITGLGGTVIGIIWCDTWGPAIVHPETCNDPDDEGWMPIRDGLNNPIQITSNVADEKFDMIKSGMRLRFRVENTPTTPINAKVIL